MNIQLCVFDMAGTTVDEDNLVYKTLQRLINQHGFNASLEQVLEHGAGKEKRQAIEDILHALNVDRAADISTEVFSGFKDALKETYRAASVQPIDGVENTLAWLRERGVLVYLNTGYDRATAEQLLNKLNWRIAPKDDATLGMAAGVIDGLVTASDVNRSRPFPDMIQLAMHLAGVDDPQCVLKAGDSAIDVQEGKSAHCGLTLGVLSGAQTREQIAQAKPDHILNSLADLPTANVIVSL